MDRPENKYMVRENYPAWHANYAFDSEPSGQDYCYDPGYSSERSPEEGDQQLVFPAIGSEDREESDHEQEQIDIFRLHPGHCYSKEDLMKMFSFISEGEALMVCVFDQ